MPEIPKSANKPTPWQKTQRSRKWFGVLMGLGMAAPIVASAVAAFNNADVAAGILLLIGGLAGMIWWWRRSRRDW